MDIVCMIKHRRGSFSASTNESPTELEIDHQEIDDATLHPAYEETRQTGKNRHPPSRYGEWVYIAQKEGPIVVKQALSSPDAEKWAKAMEAELESLHKNQVWELSELPPGRKAVRSKWVFKRKHDADGNIERYNARLVAHGYNQQYRMHASTYCNKEEKPSSFLFMLTTSSWLERHLKALKHSSRR